MPPPLPVRISVIYEDYGHEQFVGAIIDRLIHESGIRNRIIEKRTPEYGAGGYGGAKESLKKYLKALNRDEAGIPDIIIFSADSNCKYSMRQSEMDKIVKNESYDNLVIMALVEQHIERWMLVDSSAFKSVFGKGCFAPGKKCEKDLYKKLLKEEIRKNGINPPLGGMEYARDIVANMELTNIAEVSLNGFVRDLRHRLQTIKGNRDKES
jgi:hypothetical protein